VPVQHAGLAPQLGEVGRQHQHRLDHRQRTLVVLRLQQACLEIILQAQQHVAIRYRHVVRGRQFAVRTGGGLQQVAQFCRTADLTAMKRVDDHPPRAIGQPD
jgi:hypothetical protein